MPTLQDVALRAGVSTATVSKVLSNTPYFTEATRTKVMQAVEELGYMPNLAARALSSGKTNIVGVIFPYVYDTILKDPLVMHILEGIETELAQQQYNILLSTPRLIENRPDDNYMQLIRSGYFDGIIAIDNVPSVSVAHAAMERNIPSVVLGYHESDYYVRCDDYDGGKQLMEHIINLGHQHIGIISIAEDMNFAINQRVVGMRDAAQAAGVDYARLPSVESDFSTVGGARATAELLRRSPEITAIIALNDRMALGAIQHLHNVGRVVPDEISVVGYDNILLSEVATPPLTTINQKAVTLGQSCAKMLFGLLNGNSPSPVVLEPELIVRRSSAAPR